MSGCYLDASAIVKLAMHEPESSVLRTWLLARTPLITNRVSTVEVARAIRRKGEQHVAASSTAIHAAFRSVAIAELDAETAQRAADLLPNTLRALDAIHLASALALSGELDAVITYDARLADAARAAGLEVVAPA